MHYTGDKDMDTAAAEKLRLENTNMKYMDILKAPPNSIRTFSGRYLDLRNPKADQICLYDIAHGLKNEVRFAGQTLVRDTVLSHSVRVFRHIEGSNKELRTALLHDATEAFIKDIPSPLKKLLPNYIEMEKRIWLVIAEKYDLYSELTVQIKEADAADLNMVWETFNEKVKYKQASVGEFISKVNNLY